MRSFRKGMVRPPSGGLVGGGIEKTVVESNKSFAYAVGDIVKITAS